MSNHENYRNEIKAYIVRAGMTMSEVVEVLADEYGWSSSVPNLSGKLKRGSLRYGEAVELADALGVRHCVAETEEIRSSRKFMGTSVSPPESKTKTVRSLPFGKWAYLRKMFISTNNPARISSVRSTRNCCEK